MTALIPAQTPVGEWVRIRVCLGPEHAPTTACQELYHDDHRWAQDADHATTVLRAALPHLGDGRQHIHRDPVPAIDARVDAELDDYAIHHLMEGC